MEAFSQPNIPMFVTVVPNRPLMLEDIADHSCWPRWQLQRVFQKESCYIA